MTRPHGTLTSYTTQGCRCDACRMASRVHLQKRRAERRANGECVRCRAAVVGYAMCFTCRADHAEVKRRSRQKATVRSDSDNKIGETK